MRYAGSDITVRVESPPMPRLAQGASARFLAERAAARWEDADRDEFHFISVGTAAPLLRFDRMTRKKLYPDRLDRIVADGIAKHGNRRAERAARWLTLAGDERLLLPVAAALALLGEATQSRHRRDFEYLFVLLALTNGLDHLSKHLLTETRPDRLYPRFLKFGIPKSGSTGDAFPSGHALHLGATASALSRIYPNASKGIWGVAGAITATRVVLLAHWLSDAAFGFVGGVLLEKALNRLSRYVGHKLPNANARSNAADAH